MSGACANSAHGGGDLTSHGHNLEPEQPEQPEQQRGAATPASADVSAPVPLTPAAATARRTPILAGKYRLEREIDGGAMGRVFAAVQLGLDRPVVVKVMRDVHSEFRVRFLLEAKSLAKLNHRNIVSIIDFGETPNGVVFIVMEYLRGQTLGDALRREARIDVPRTVQLAIQMARGLRAAHHQGIIHRDLKPSNIFLLDDEEGGELVKLLDFGVAKALDDDAPDAQRVTREGIIVGTPQYMAPETITNDANARADGRADLYSLGCVLYQMIGGRPPFVPVNGPLEVLSAHLRTEPDALSLHAPWVPPGLEALVMRLLRKDPAERFASAEALLQGLKEQLALIFNDPFRPTMTDPSMDAIPLIRTPTPPAAFSGLFAQPPPPSSSPSHSPRPPEDVTAVDIDPLDPPDPLDATVALPLDQQPRPVEPRNAWRARLRTAWTRARGAILGLRRR